MVLIEKNIQGARQVWQAATAGFLVLVGFLTLLFVAVPRISSNASQGVFGPDVTHADAPGSGGDGGSGGAGDAGGSSGGDGGSGDGGGGCDGSGGGGCGM